MLSLPPLTLYVHLPWCVRKCPYCDFNSHAVRGEIPAERYVDALLQDLESDLHLVWGRPVHSVFLGGGTPSLFTADQLGRLLEGVRSRLRLAPDAEITLEANPGTIEHDSFAAYRGIGINRVSLGVQSFDEGALQRIGRIHGAGEARAAIESLHRAGIGNFNIDLMFALPGQALAGAVADIAAAIASQPAHVSHYQLTLEPNTAFFAAPPRLPDDEAAWQMQQECAARLEAAGFAQYEISAWSRPGHECRHNLNYWHYGDFVGIGAGAHGKLTLPAEGTVRRMSKHRHPKKYLDGLATGEFRAEVNDLDAPERIFEFFLNQLRLASGVDLDQLPARAGVPERVVAERLGEAQERGLLTREGMRLRHTELGWRFVNDSQALFLPGADQDRRATGRAGTRLANRQASD